MSDKHAELQFTKAWKLGDTEYLLLIHSTLKQEDIMDKKTKENDPQTQNPKSHMKQDI